MRNELQCVLDAVREMPPDQLPELLGELEVVRATAMMKLSAPAPAHPPHQADALLDVTEAAQRLGMSEKYLYKHASRLPFYSAHGPQFAVFLLWHCHISEAETLKNTLD